VKRVDFFGGVWYNMYVRKRNEVSVMLIAVIILAWLLVNTWLSLVLAQIKGTFFSGWDDLAWLLLYVVVNPFLAVLVARIIYAIVKFAKKN
jgi:hypothetical protein